MSRRTLWCVLIITTALTFAALERVTLHALDFRAFYCAGIGARQHANPYRTQPLQSCESNSTDQYYATFSRSVALPAPLPGYDIALFEPLTFLPFPAAKALWTLALAIAVAVSVIALVRFTRLSALTVFAALWLSLTFPAFEFGELIAIAVAAICVAALCAQRESWTAAAIAATIALVEPHLGLPVWLALLVWRPQARLPLISGAAMLALISYATLGYAENLEYFTTVLPLHALSEIGSDAQLSLSVVLHYAGVSDELAVRLGTLWYAAMMMAGIYLGGALARRFAEGGFVVAVPAALVLLGGSFMHVTDMAAALPLAMIASTRVPQYRYTSIGAIILLALPWWHLSLMIQQRQFLFGAMAAIVALYLALDLSKGNVTYALRWTAATLIVLFGLTAWYANSTHTFPAPVPTVAISRDYPEASWAWANAKFISTGTPASWALRIPSWLGLVMLAGGIAPFAFRKPIMVLQP